MGAPLHSGYGRIKNNASGFHYYRNERAQTVKREGEFISNFLSWDSATPSLCLLLFSMRKKVLFELSAALVLASSVFPSLFTLLCLLLPPHPPPPWVCLPLLHLCLSLSPSLLDSPYIFLRGKHFHLRYGWLFNAVSLSELEEAWCSGLLSLVCKWIPHKKIK